MEKQTAMKKTILYMYQHGGGNYSLSEADFDKIEGYTEEEVFYGVKEGVMKGLILDVTSMDGRGSILSPDGVSLAKILDKTKGN